MEQKLIYGKMVDVMNNIGAVSKDQKVSGAMSYKFRGIDDMINAVNPALRKAGVAMTMQVLSRSENLVDVVRSSGKQATDKHVCVTVKYTFYAEDGSFVESISVGEGVDSGDKATNKALSGALKYALIQTFNIVTEDLEDADKEASEDTEVLSNKNTYKKQVKNVQEFDLIDEVEGGDDLASLTCKIGFDEQDKRVVLKKLGFGWNSEQKAWTKIVDVSLISKFKKDLTEAGISFQ